MIQAMKTTLLLCLFAMASTALAQQPAVTASLSDTTTPVGRPVQLKIEVTGSRNCSPPQDIQIDGLEIQYRGQQTQFRMENFKTSSSVSFTYLVLPMRVGDFEIPALEVPVDGKPIRTAPLKLSATAGQSPAGTPQGSAGADASSTTDSSEMVFAETILPRESAFVGEAIPIEVRVYFAENVAFQIDGPPQLNEEGFTTRRMPQPRQSTEVREGRRYNVVSFRTAITPIKPGSLSLGPVEVRALVQIPEPRAKRQRSPFDDLFGEDLFNMLPRVRTQQVTVRSEPVTLESKPLPAKDRPEDFRGAVGQFQLDTEAPSTKGSTGEPMKLRAIVRGRGDFTRIEPPTLAGDTGWRSYPPSEKFDADDELELSGRKTWDFSLVPEQPNKALPMLKFSYFDPVTETYETLQTEPIPVTLSGAPISSPTPAVPSGADPSATPAPQTAPVVAGEADILHILPSPGRQIAGRMPDKKFWQIQGVLALLAVVGALGAWIHRRISDKSRSPMGARTRQLQDLESKLRAASGPDFFRVACNWVDLKTKSSAPQDAATRAEIEWLRGRRDEGLYSGHTSGLQPADRDRAQAVIAQLSKQP